MTQGMMPEAKELGSLPQDGDSQQQPKWCPICIAAVQKEGRLLHLIVRLSVPEECECPSHTNHGVVSAWRARRLAAKTRREQALR